MKEFKKHTGKLALLDRGNIDTDQIIAKQFLKSIKKTGFGPQLFYDWRYQSDGSQDPNFELNRPEFEGASILVTGNNFGCGSSREHAVWAVVQYGFQVLIAPQKKSNQGIIPGFADIFKNNSTKNGLLCIELSEEEVTEIKHWINETPGLQATIDLENNDITFHLKEEEMTISFDIDPSVKKRFLEGLDDIGITEQNLDKIQGFEDNHDSQLA